MADEKPNDSVALEITFHGTALTGPQRAENIKKLQAAVDEALNSGTSLKDSFAAKLSGAPDQAIEYESANIRKT
jgi:hypothetical protein